MLYIRGLSEILPLPKNLANLLKNLAIWNSKSIQLTYDNFKDLTNVRTLTLGQDDIQSIPANVFSTMTNLSFLLLNDNPITKIDRDAFKFLKQLNIVNLVHTNLTAIDLSIFPSTTVWPIFELPLYDNPSLKNLTVSDPDQFPADAGITITNSGLENIDIKLGDLLKKKPRVWVNLGYNINLKCGTLGWMAEYVRCTQQLYVEDATCADQKDQALDEYLKNFPASCD